MNEDDKRRILNLLIDNPSLILLLKNKYIDEDIWEFCLEREPSLFKHIKNPSIKLCNYAIELDGNNLKYILNKHSDIKVTRKMLYVAVDNCPKVIREIPEIIIDEGLKELAFDRDPSLMQYFNYIRKSYIEQRVKENPSIIQYIKNPDEELICKTLKEEPNIVLYFDKITPAMATIIDKHHPHLIPLIDLSRYI